MDEAVDFETGILNFGGDKSFGLASAAGLFFVNDVLTSLAGVGFLDSFHSYARIKSMNEREHTRMAPSVFLVARRSSK